MKVRSYFPPGGKARIAIVGEAPGKTEEEHGLPFVGQAGRLLTDMLREAGINRQECYITNVFWTRPEHNDIKQYCRTKTEVGGKDYEYPMLAGGCYFTYEALMEPDVQDWEHIKSHFEEEPPQQLRNHTNVRTILDRLRLELTLVQPNVVIALGNTACWALLGRTKITQLRGVATESSLLPSLKILPTLHPAAVLRLFELRFQVVQDLQKAREEAGSADITRPEREIWIDPTVEDLAEFKRLYLDSATSTSFDIETEARQITCIGFAPDPAHALVIPFLDKSKPGYHYWESEEDERVAWSFIREVLTGPLIKIAQNGMYDIQYLWRAGIPVLNYTLDTMFMHHALHLELPKTLGFLGSVYTNEGSWKILRTSKATKMKGDD